LSFATQPGCLRPANVWAPPPPAPPRPPLPTSAPALSPIHSPPYLLPSPTSSLSLDHTDGRPSPERMLLTVGEDDSLAASTRHPSYAPTTPPFLCSDGIWRFFTTGIGRARQGQGRLPRVATRADIRAPPGGPTSARRQDRRAPPSGPTRGCTATREDLRARPRPLQSGSARHQGDDQLSPAVWI
jgi:hypothetical protein